MMDISQESLPYIFSDDLIYVVNDEGTAVEGDATPKEPQAIQTSTAPTTPPTKIPVSATSQVEEPRTDYYVAKVLVLIETEPTIEENTLLENILKAIDITPAAVERITAHPAKLNELKTTKLILSFHPEYAPKKDYEVIQANHLQIIYAHSLAELQNNITYKKQLWSNLKSIKV